MEDVKETTDRGAELEGSEIDRTLTTIADYNTARALGQYNGYRQAVKDLGYLLVVAFVILVYYRASSRFFEV